MPTYTFRSRSSGLETTERMTIAEMEARLASDPDTYVVIAPVGYADSWRIGVSRSSEGFRDVLRTIKKNNPGSTIDV